MRKARYEKSQLFVVVENVVKAPGRDHAESALAYIEGVPPVVVAHRSVVPFHADQPPAQCLRNNARFTPVVVSCS